MNNSRLKIGTNLKKAREYLGISQEEVASKLGISRSAVSLIENGKRKVESVELISFSKLYQQPVSYFTEQKDPETDRLEEINVLARTAEDLSEKDRDELIKFAEFLKQKSKMDV